VLFECLLVPVPCGCATVFPTVVLRVFAGLQFNYITYECGNGTGACVVNDIALALPAVRPRLIRQGGRGVEHKTR